MRLENFVDSNNYNYKNWNTNISLKKLINSHEWDDFFDNYLDPKILKSIEKNLKTIIKEGDTVYPPPKLLFNSINTTTLKNIRVVFVGQDPYPGECKSTKIPYAMGMSFSVPHGCDTPASLKNIYKNMKKFKHIKNMPKSGNLIGWALQGCLFYNTTLTVTKGKSNSHSKIWKEFSRKFIEYLSLKKNNIIFVAWGNYAIDILKNVDRKKHSVLKCSHPSPLSFNKSVNRLEDGKNIIIDSFERFDTFGKINEQLIKYGKNPIIWDVLDLTSSTL
mgnify:CR=1 FL=1